MREPLRIEIKGPARDSVTAVPEGVSVHRIDLAAIVNEQASGVLRAGAQRQARRPALRRHCMRRCQSRQFGERKAPESDMASRVIAVGDIHGCAAAFDQLLALIQPKPDDTLVVLGDCVDRGPDSFRVIQRLLELRESCHLVTILGNHEEMMLNYVDGRPQPDNWLLCGGASTLQSYQRVTGSWTVLREHLDFIRTWGDYFVTEDHFFVHAAYHPEQAFAEQRWQHWRWHAIRYEVPEAHRSGKTAIVGHTSQTSGEILDVGHLVCIDTCCWSGGWLTGLDVSTGQVWQVDREGRKRQPDGTSSAK